MGSDSSRVYEPARLRGHETEKTKASIATAAAAYSGHFSRASRGRPGVSRARPAPRQAPPITIEARGKMKESSAVGRKTVGSVRARPAGKYSPRRPRNSQIEPPPKEIRLSSWTLY